MSVTRCQSIERHITCISKLKFKNQVSICTRKCPDNSSPDSPVRCRLLQNFSTRIFIYIFLGSSFFLLSLANPFPAQKHRQDFLIETQLLTTAETSAIARTNLTPHRLAWQKVQIIQDKWTSASSLQGFPTLALATWNPDLHPRYYTISSSSYQRVTGVDAMTNMTGSASSAADATKACSLNTNIAALISLISTRAGHCFHNH